MLDLQADFKILPIGVTEAGPWHYAYAYDIVPRHFSEQIEQSHTISDQLARQTLTKRYLLSVGAAPYNDICKLFGWSRKQVDCIIESLVRINFLQQGLNLGNQPDEWIALNDLVE